MRRRRVAATATWVFGVVLLLVGVVLWELHRGADDLSADGVRTVATVTEVTATPRGSGGPSITIGVAFATSNGATHAGSIDLGRTSRLFTVGSAVDIVYDRDDPSRFAVVGSSSDTSPVPWTLPAVIGLGFVAIGVVAVRRVRWEAKLLADNPWVVADSEIIEVPHTFRGRERATRVLQLTGAPDMSVVMAAPAGLRSPAMVEFAPQAWVAGSGRRFVVAAPGGSPLLRMERMRPVPPALDHDGPMQ